MLIKNGHRALDIDEYTVERFNRYLASIGRVNHKEGIVSRIETVLDTQASIAGSFEKGVTKTYLTSLEEQFDGH